MTDPFDYCYKELMDGIAAADREERERVAAMTRWNRVVYRWARFRRNTLPEISAILLVYGVPLLLLIAMFYFDDGEPEQVEWPTYEELLEESGYFNDGYTPCRSGKIGGDC